MTRPRLQPKLQRGTKSICARSFQPTAIRKVSLCVLHAFKQAWSSSWRHCNGTCFTADGPRVVSRNVRLSNHTSGAVPPPFLGDCYSFVASVRSTAVCSGPRGRRWCAAGSGTLAFPAHAACVQSLMYIRLRRCDSLGQYCVPFGGFPTFRIATNVSASRQLREASS